jgi:hypothetical protein
MPPYATSHDFISAACKERGVELTLEQHGAVVDAVTTWGDRRARVAEYELRQAFKTLLDLPKS